MKLSTHYAREAQSLIWKARGCKTFKGGMYADKPRVKEVIENHVRLARQYNQYAIRLRRTGQ